MTTPPPWDSGIDYHVDELEAPPAPLDVQWVIENHLKLPAESADAGAVARYLAAATRLAQRTTTKALIDQRKILKLSGFPFGFIQIPSPPLIEIVAFDYIDSDGITQSLVGSPIGYQLQQPVGGNPRPARLYPTADAGCWPTTATRTVDPVSIEFRAGYVDRAASPEVGEVPEDILEGILLTVAEMHKQRSESIVGFGVSVNPALVRARNLWLPYGIGVYR